MRVVARRGPARSGQDGAVDSLIAAAARALAAGDVLGALTRVALRDDAPALALRGIAMAQLGEYAQARVLLQRAIRAFGARESLSRARCIVADAEVALAIRDLRLRPRTLTDAAAALEARGDHVNARHARLIAVRRLLLLGQIGEAAAALALLDGQGAPPSLAAVAELARAEIALRTLHVSTAREALARALTLARDGGVPALAAEAMEAGAALDLPAARRVADGGAQPMRLDAIEELFASNTVVVDACRHGLRLRDTWIPLARRPTLFALLRGLAEGWPAEVDRHALIVRAFHTRYVDETHRARLRVEIGRLRALCAPLAEIASGAHGFRLVTLEGRDVAVLVPPIDGEPASLLALLADGTAWSTSALAQALGTSQRTVQRALVELETAGRVRAIGRTRTRRWLAPPLPGFTTVLLLPASLPDG